MFRTLVVPLDGSAEAERALPYAVRLARASGGRLALVRTALAPPPSGFDWGRQQLAAVGEAETYLANVAAKLATRVEVATTAPYGDTPAKLLESVAALGADAIVMATHGRTGLDHLLHGSVAEAVLAHSPVPVFLVYARPGEVQPPVFEPSSARILVPLDGSTFSESALPFAVELLGPSGELVLVSVAAPPDHVEFDDNGRPRAYLDEQEAALKRQPFDYLRRIVAQLKQTNPDLNVTMDIRVGDPAPGIVMAEMDRAADLVVMSTHGRTGIGRAVMGSVAGEVLRTGRAPVVLVGPASAHTLVRPAQASAINA